MAHRSKKLASLLSAALLLALLPACTELGDLVVVEFTLTRGQVTLQELDQNFLPKKNWGASPKCLARRSQVGMQQYTGICLDSEENIVLIYRAFELKFKAEERGITEELLKSEGYGELKSIADGVEKHLHTKGIKYTRRGPYYQDFEPIHEKFRLTR